MTFYYSPVSEYVGTTEYFPPPIKQYMKINMISPTSESIDTTPPQLTLMNNHQYSAAVIAEDTYLRNIFNLSPHILGRVIVSMDTNAYNHIDFMILEKDSLVLTKFIATSKLLFPTEVGYAYYSTHQSFTYQVNLILANKISSFKARFMSNKPFSLIYQTIYKKCLGLNFNRNGLYLPAELNELNRDLLLTWNYDYGIKE